MKYVDILTAQNVEISFQLASPSQRIFAFLIDLIIMSILASIIFFILASLDFDENIVLIFYIPTIFCYSILSEVFMNGQTLGKKLLKIKVIKLIGGEPRFFDYAIRWVFKPVDIWFSGGSIATILCFSSLKNQRLGDILAGTTVVNAEPDKNIFLKDISKAAHTNDYVPTYPEVAQLNESQMLVIKETLDKNFNINNPAHKEALNELSTRVAKKLQITNIQESRENFLRTLIRDYVQLTR